MKNLTASPAVPLLALLLLFAAETLQAQRAPLEELRQKFENGEIFNGQFEHRSIDSYTEDTTSENGNIWVGREEYKVRTSDQSVVVDGETSRVYNEKRNRVIISRYEPAEDDFAPSRILNGIDSTYTVQTQEERDSETYIVLSSDDPFAIYKEVEIFLAENLIPSRIRVVDPADNILITTFSDGKFISAAEDMFSLDYPDSAEVIDMRNN